MFLLCFKVCGPLRKRDSELHSYYRPCLPTAVVNAATKNLTEIPVPIWSNGAHCRNLWQTIPIETNIRVGLISHNLTLTPTLLICCPSYSFPSVLLSLSVLSSPPASCLVLPPCRAVVSLQPPQSSTQGELEAVQTWPPWVPAGWLPTLVPRLHSRPVGLSWQLREAIVEERLTTHGSHCAKQKHMHTHLYWDIQSHAFPQHGFYCFPIKEDVKCYLADVTSQRIEFHKVSVWTHTLCPVIIPAQDIFYS